MRTRLFGIMLVTGLALTACGGDDDGGGGGGSVQDQVADMMVDSINETMAGEDTAGVSIDEDCVRDAAQQLSDDDAQKILDAGPEGDPDVSDDAMDAGESLMECIDIDFSELDVDG